MRLIRNLAAGALAGAVGTAAMDFVLWSRYRRGGGKESFGRWEFAADVMSWEQASAPGQLGRKAVRKVTGEEPRDEWARPMTNLVHWATGIGWGVQYGALASVTSRLPWLRALTFGPVAWLSGYVILPLAKVYQPIWEYDAKTLARDLGGHLAYGAGTGTAFWLFVKLR